MSTDNNNSQAIKTLNPRKVWIPVVFSVGILVYMLFTDDLFSAEKLNLIFTAKTWPLVWTGLLLVVKELAYIYRIRFLSNGALSFTASTYIILLWEFASAVTPSVVGGTPVAVFLMLKEGINLGKSLAYAMVTAIFDNLYLVIFAPIIFFTFEEELFQFMTPGVLTDNLHKIFYGSYILIVLYTGVMSYALFLKPRWFKWLLLKITSVRILRKWRYGAYQHGNEIMLASKELRGTDFRYWWRIGYTTFLSWTARFGLLNLTIMAFVKLDLWSHILAFSKNIILWVLMLISPTPGSSGAAEFGFSAFFEEMLGNFTGPITILWRAYSYYPFLIIGIILLPRWIARVYFKRSLSKEKNESLKPEE